MHLNLPHNVAAEQQILGALLLKDSLIYDLTEEVTAEDFYDPGHQAIYRTIEALVFGGKRANVTFVRDYLGAAEAKVRVDEVYLDALTSAVASINDASIYAKQVADLARRRRLMLRLAEGIGDLGSLDPNTSSQTLIDRIETDILGATRVDSNSVRRLGDYAKRSVTKVIDAIENPNHRNRGVSWGLTAVDNVTGPVFPGKFIVLGGRPGGGKSALAGQAAENFAKQRPGYVQSLEMMGEEWAERLMAQHCDIAAWRISQADLKEAEVDRLLDAADRLKALPVWIDQKPRLTIDQIRARAIRFKHRHDIGWMIVDHLHIVSPGSKRQDRLEATNNVAFELKQIAKDLEIGVIALAQLNKDIRGRDDGRPRAGDLLYYSAIEPHADSIIFSHRPEIAMAEKRPDPIHQADRFHAWESMFNAVKGTAEIINAKRRGGESYGTQPCLFHGPTMRFSDLQDKPRKSASQEMKGWQ